jgi:hypothetical protein
MIYIVAFVLLHIVAVGLVFALGYFSGVKNVFNKLATKKLNTK